MFFGANSAAQRAQKNIVLFRGVLPKNEFFFSRYSAFTMEPDSSAAENQQYFKIFAKSKPYSKPY